MFKKMTALCLAACLCLGLAGCGKAPAQQPASGGAPQSQGAASGSAPA